MCGDSSDYHPLRSGLRAVGEEFPLDLSLPAPKPHRVGGGPAPPGGRDGEQGHAVPVTLVTSLAGFAEPRRQQGAVQQEAVQQQAVVQQRQEQEQRQHPHEPAQEPPQPRPASPSASLGVAMDQEEGMAAVGTLLQAIAESDGSEGERALAAAAKGKRGRPGGRRAVQQKGPRSRPGAKAAAAAPVPSGAPAQALGPAGPGAPAAPPAAAPPAGYSLPSNWGRHQPRGPRGAPQAMPPREAADQAAFWAGPVSAAGSRVRGLMAEAEDLLAAAGAAAGYAAGLEATLGESCIALRKIRSSWPGRWRWPGTDAGNENENGNDKMAMAMTIPIMNYNSQTMIMAMAMALRLGH